MLPCWDARGTTRDVDALVWLEKERWEDFLSAGARFGLLPRLADTLKFARRTRMLLVRHQASGIDADIVFGSLPFEAQAIKRARSVKLGGVAFKVPAPEDLIIMKALAGRPRDVGDIEGLLDTQPKLNLRRIRRCVREFSAALEKPEILETLEAMLAQRRKRKQR